MKHALSNYIVTGVFLLIIAVFTIWTWSAKDLKLSVLENRNLTQRPDANVESVISGDYTKRFESYYNDQFPTRERFVEINSKINKYVLRQDVVRNVYVHKDGYLLSPVKEGKDSDAEKIAGKINTFTEKAKELGADTYFTLMPNKSTTMEDKFPGYFPSFGKKNTAQLMKKISPSAHPVNPLLTVQSHLDKGNMYFYSDHHWKAKAAFYAYQDVMAKMAEDDPAVGAPRKFDDYEWKEEGKPFYGSDARTTTKAYVKKHDTVTVATPKFSEEKINVCYNAVCDRGFYNMDLLDRDELYTNRYGAYLGGDHPETAIYNPNKKGQTLLIIKDSYANAAIQFFARHFEETRVLDLRHYKKMNVEQYIKTYEVDKIIILHNVNSIYVTPSLTNYEHPGMGENQ
ncbi:DHHW family protein [Peribacillus sp. SCS-37]|uniref:DHHW family protein n=1 Tax=Paraperibacillus esterisolvens TaxID=3115296 RepID=UPI003906B341